MSMNIIIIIKVKYSIKETEIYSLVSFLVTQKPYL